MSDISEERVARILYECERQRGEHANRVLSDAAGKVVLGASIEPWDECKDIFLADARAVLTALGTSARTVQQENQERGRASLIQRLRYIVDHVTAMTTEVKAACSLAAATLEDWPVNTRNPDKPGGANA